jgi:regulator of sigma E protease
VNGAPVQDWNRFTRLIRSSPGRPLQLAVNRADTAKVLTATPRPDQERVDGRSQAVGRLGVLPAAPEQARRPVGFLRAWKLGFLYTWETSAAIGDVLRKLVTGQMSTSNLGGLISIGQASGESARMGLEYFLGFLALFSVNLAILNLLPIPILDGGHLMFLLAEALRGRPLSVETRVRLSQLGLIVVVALMLLANGNDVVRVVQGWMGS